MTISVRRSWSEETETNRSEAGGVLSEVQWDVDLVETVTRNVTRFSFIAIVCVLLFGVFVGVTGVSGASSGNTPELTNNVGLENLALGGTVEHLNATGETATTIDNDTRITPTQFDTSEGDVLWESNVTSRLGTDRAPTVVDGILVVGTGDSASQDRVVAYDIGTGEQRWTTDVPVRGSPTVVDGTVYVSDTDGLWALDLKLGTIDWHVEFDEDATSSTRQQSVGDGSVYVSWSDSSSGQVLSVDADTGDENWNISTDRPVRSGPTFNNGTVYFVSSLDGMTAVDAATGHEQWTWNDIGVLEGTGAATEPTVADGLVYLSYTQGIASNDPDPDDYELFTVALDEETGEQAWEVEFDDPQPALLQTPSSPTVSSEGGESTVYVSLDGLYALNATDGTERWSDDDGVFDAPAAAGGTLFVSQSSGSETFRALDPNDGSELWSVETGERGTLIVVDGVAYVLTILGDERIMAFDAGVSESSSDSRVMLGGQNHHHEWDGEIPDIEPRIVDTAFDEGVFTEDELTVLATVRNDWNPTTSAIYTLELDDDPQVSRTIDVPAYGTNTVALPMTAPDTAGEYTLAINGEEIGTVTVVDETDPVFRSVNPFFDTRLEGDLIQIAYDATNLGDEFVSEENATLALEGPAFDGREDVAFAGLGEGINPGETRTAVLVTDPIDEPGEYTAFLANEEIGNITVLPEDEPIYLTDTNRLQDSIISGIEAPVDPSVAGEASVDVRYENLGESQDSVESELVAYDDEGTEVADVTETIVVGSESNVTERLSVSLAEEGVYDLEVDGTPVGEVEVLVDGVQDGDSIQAAIDAALPGDEVVVGNGTYEESLTIDKPLTLRTVSEGGAVLDGSGEEFERAITVTDDDVTVDGFRIEGYTGSGGGFDDAAVVVSGEGFTFRNNTLTDSVDGIQTQSNEDAHGIVIADNHIYENDGDAIMFANRVNDASVLRNTITDNGGDGIDLGNRNDRFTVDANEIHRNAAGITYEQTGGDDGEVTNNTVTDNSGAGIDLGSTSAPDNVVEHNTVTGNENGITAGQRAEIRHNNVTAIGGNGIEVTGSAVVTNNTLTDVGSIGIEPGASTEIKYNNFTDVSIGINSDADNLEIHGNKFADTDTDLRLEKGFLGVDGATVTDNQFATGIILIDLPDEPHEMSDNTVGGDPLVYIEGEDDPTIDADAGQIILVDVTNAELEGFSFSDVTAGIQVTHSEGISITDSGFTDIRAPSPTVVTDSAGVVSVSYSSGVTIDEFTVTNSERGILVTDSDNVTVSNGTISANADRGIRLDDTDDVTVEHNTITGEYNDGIRVDTSETLSVAGNEVTGASRGMGIVAATDAVITDNTIDDSATGVRFGRPIGFGPTDIQGLTFTNNTISGASDGVAMPRGSITDGARLTENRIIGSDGVGLDVDIGEDGATVANNTVTINEVGMDLTRRGGTPVQNLDVTDNTIEDNEGDGLRLDGDINVTVTDNSIAGNTVGIEYSGFETLDARNNWWGNTTGPSGDITDPHTGADADGDGDRIEAPNGDVRFDPWLDAPIAGTGTVSGTVTDADTGDPLSDASVEVLDGSAVIDSAKTGADGAYELTLLTGTYDVAANADGYEEAFEEDVAIDDDEETIANLTLTPTQDGSIEGTVIDAEGGDPIAGAAIEVVEQEGVGEPPAIGGFTTTVETNEDGDFTANVPPGVYEYTVSKTGFDEAGGKDVEVGSGQQVDLATIELTAFPVVTGTVTDTVTGDPIEGVSIESSATGATEAFDTAETNTTGEYVITVPEEVTQLEFTSPGYLPKDVFVDGQEIDGSKEVDVSLTLEDDLGLVTGTVTRESTGQPVQGAIVLATDENDTQVDGDSTDGDGVYELQVEPGTYTITATDEGGPGLPESGTVEDVEVSAGEQKTVDIELTPIDFLPPSNVSVAIDEAESVTDVIEGENITVVANISNTGDDPLDQEVLFGVFDQGGNETLYESEPEAVTIGSKETKTLNFSVESESEFDNTTAIVASGEPGADEAAAFDVVGLSVSPLDPEPKLSFTDQPLVDGTVLVENVTTEQESTLLITYTDGDEETVAGLAPADNLDQGDIEVTIEDDSGIPGEHTAWLLADDDIPGDIGIGDDVTPIAGDALDSESAFLTSPPAPELDVVEASVTPTQLEVGDEATINATVENVGDADGNLSVPFRIDDEEVNSTTVTLDVGEQRDVTFTWTFEEAGEFHLDVDGVDAGTVAVIEDADADVIIYGADVNRSSLLLGESVSITGDLLNNGGSGTFTVDFDVNGERVETKTVDVDPGVSPGAVTFEWTPTEADLPGDADELDAKITLNGFVVDTVHIENPYSDITVIQTSSSALELVEGEEMYVVGSLYQAGTIEGPETVELTATNTDTGESEVVASQEVTVGPGMYLFGGINVTFALEEAGTYELALGDRTAGTVEVEPAESDITVIQASSSALELVEGEEMYVVGSLYQAGNIEGPETVELTATNTDTGESEVVASQEVTVRPGMYLFGGINVTFAFEEAGTYELALGDRTAGTVEVEPAESDITVIQASSSALELIEGEEMYVVGSLYQAGTIEGPETIELTATNTDTGESEVVASQEVTVGPGNYLFGGINVTFALEEAGTYDLALGDRSAGTVEVEPSEADIRVIAASASEVEVIEGEELYVVGSIQNQGDDEGTEEVELTATNTETNETELLGSQEVTLGAGNTHLGALNITAEFDEAGTYDLSLGDRDAGLVAVEEAITDITVVAASAGGLELVEGEESYVVGSVYQNGTAAKTEEIELTATNTETNETAVLGSQEVTVEPGMYLLGALNITYAFAEAGTYDLALGDRTAGTVEVEAAESDITVIQASNSRVEMVEGEEMYVVGSVYQRGNIEGPETVEMTATNTDTGESEVVASQDVTVGPGNYLFGGINVSFALEEAGTYDLALGDRDAGTVEVEAAESDMIVIQASNSRVEMVEGEEMYVVGSVYQNGTIEGPETVNLTATNTDTGESEVVASQEVTVGPGMYLFGGINVTFALEEAGTYDLALGDRTAGTVEVSEPTVELSAVEVEGYSEAFDPESDTVLMYAGEDATVSVDIDADLELETVNVLISSLERAYVRAFEANHEDGETWGTTIPLADIGDDGRYEVSVVAVDDLGNAGTADADTPLVIDRDAPRLSATLEDVDGESATVVVETDKPLSEPPEVDGVFTAPDGSTENGSVAMLPVGGSATHFTGSFATGETGTYEITSSGTDRAGNEGSDDASVTVDTQLTLESGPIEIEGTGTAIDFTVADGVDEAVITQELFASLSETTANANLAEGDLGVGFITAELDNLLHYYLDDGTIESADITMAIDETELPDGVSADDVELQYYDDASGSWTSDPILDSTIEYDGNDPFLSASVTGFSTYGLFVPPSDGTLHFYDQELVDGTVTVENVAAEQDSTIFVTYTDGDEETVAGLTTVDTSDGEDVPVAIEDNAGIPGEHTAWLLADDDIPGDIGIGDDVTPIAGDALASDSAELTASLEPGLESIELSVEETTLLEGSTTQATVTATFDDNSTADVTGDATFDSSDTGVVSVNGATLTAEEAGTATVTATYEQETDSVQITVNTEPSAPADYANSEGIVDTSGLLNAIGDWRGNVIETSLLLDVINDWRSGEVIT